MRARTIASVALGLAALSASVARAQDLPRGTVIDDVTCAADASQSYALYLPAAYTPERNWNLLIGFHPAANGRAIVETYRAAAERYGYIVAASNVSRNGPMAVSAASVEAMSRDLGGRFAIDAARIYATGHSGGSRVAMLLGLSGSQLAGVIASSAGFPDSQPRASVPFPVFSTAGTEDFNYIEMRLLDRKLTSPHRLVVFEGGHTLPPDTVALEAIEWLELQAMKKGTRARDESMIDRLLETQRRLVDAAASPADAVHRLEAIVADFDGLRDVSAETARLKMVTKQADVKKSLAREREADDAELRLLADVFDLEAALHDDSRRSESLARLRDRLARLFKTASASVESPKRTQARRVLRAITSGAAGRVQNPEYLKLLDAYRLPRM